MREIDWCCMSLPVNDDSMELKFDFQDSAHMVEAHGWYMTMLVRTVVLLVLYVSH
jgi:hypothetical protein